MRPFSLRSWSVFIAGVLLAAVILSMAGLIHARRTCGAILDEARIGARHEAEGFAQATAPWILSDIYYYHLLDRIVEVMLQSGTLFIEVSHLGEVIVDERTAAWEHRALPEPPATIGDVLLFREADLWMLDALVPIRAEQPDVGWVRIGMDATDLAARLGNERLATSLVTLCLWLGVSGLGAIVCRPRRRISALAPQPAADVEDGLSLPPNEAPLQRGRFTIDSRSKSASYGEHDLLLSPKPFLLLELLAREHGRVFDDQEIIQYVWTDAPYVNSNDVRQCVYRLRCRLNEIEMGLGDCIANVKGFGYRFDPERE